MPRTHTRVDAENRDPQAASTSHAASRPTLQQTRVPSRGSSWKEVKPVELIEEAPSSSHPTGGADSSEDEETEIRIKDLDSGKEFTVLKARQRLEKDHTFA